MTEVAKIMIKKGRDEAVKRRHHWIFSGAVHSVSGSPENGDLVEVEDIAGIFLALGHYQKGSILVRIISFEKTEINQKFWVRKLSEAYAVRQALGLIGNKSTNAYRLIHGEGDGLPGLIIDIYGKAAVVQTHSLGMAKAKNDICEALKITFKDGLDTIFDKSKEVLPETANAENLPFLLGDEENTIIKEYDHQFFVDWVQGQKTGFFLDQRENRKLLSTFTPGKTVLNAFSYSGGFSVYALKAGAKHVDSVDASQKAIDWVDKNVALNPSKGTHTSHCQDVMKYLRKCKTDYDVIILDPPAFAKRRSARHKAIQGYKRLNIEGMKRIKPGGILFTFSCSQVIDHTLFRDTIVAAALESGRETRVIHDLVQAPDHPVNLFHPEGSYLKGLVLYFA